MEALIATLRMILGDRRGQGLAEYALILVLIAIVVMIGLQFLGNRIYVTIMQVWLDIFRANLGF